MSAPLLAWYGDDFTGASDTLAVLRQAGLRAMLFLQLPDAAQRQRAERVLGGELQALGIAGATRSMPPAAMAQVLAAAGEFLASLQPAVLHYKVCSTFDSAPGTGSIGVAVRTLRPHVRNPLVAIVAGQPSLGRYCAFSNLFAAAGQASAVERIDRHPTMRNHPVTPMREADLRRHLALQGLQASALHYPLYAQPQQVQDRAVADALAAGADALLMDVADASHLAPVGRILWQQALQQRTLAVGSSAVPQALIAHWQQQDDSVFAPDALPASASTGGPAFVLAGSLSPVTARQVRAARAYELVRLDAQDLADPAAACLRIGAALDAGCHVLACTAPADVARADTAHASDTAAATARLLRTLVDRQALRGRPLRRIGIAGGDTSSLAVQALGLWGLSFAGTLGEGVCISRAHSDDPALDGALLMLKGGQMGAEKVFDEFAAGESVGAVA